MKSVRMIRKKRFKTFTSFSLLHLKKLQNMINMEEKNGGKLSLTWSKRFNAGERTNHSKDQQMMKRHMLIHPLKITMKPQLVTNLF